MGPEGGDRGLRVSTYATLFSLLIDEALVQPASIAGLFLDLGLSELPADLRSKELKNMTPEEAKRYRAHPELSVKILQGKRMVISTEIQEAILRHHEKYDGSGYPKGYRDSRLSPLHQIVAIASRFEDLSFGPEAKLPRNLAEILSQIEAERIASPEVLNNLRLQLFGRIS